MWKRSQTCNRVNIDGQWPFNLQVSIYKRSQFDLGNVKLILIGYPKEKQNQMILQVSFKAHWEMLAVNTPQKYVEYWLMVLSCTSQSLELELNFLKRHWPIILAQDHFFFAASCHKIWETHIVEVMVFVARVTRYRFPNGDRQKKVIITSMIRSLSITACELVGHMDDKDLAASTYHRGQFWDVCIPCCGWTL